MPRLVPYPRFPGETWTTKVRGTNPDLCSRVSVRHVPLSQPHGQAVRWRDVLSPQSLIHLVLETGLGRAVRRAPHRVVRCRPDLLVEVGGYQLLGGCVVEGCRFAFEGDRAAVQHAQAVGDTNRKVDALFDE